MFILQIYPDIIKSGKRWDGCTLRAISLSCESESAASRAVSNQPNCICLIFKVVFPKFCKQYFKFILMSSTCTEYDMYSMGNWAISQPWMLAASRAVSNQQNCISLILKVGFPQFCKLYFKSTWMSSNWIVCVLCGKLTSLECQLHQEQLQNR